MTIVLTLAEPSTQPSGASYAPGVCSGPQGDLRPSHGMAGTATSVSTEKPFVGEWLGSEPSAARPRPDAVSILDPHAASAPRRRSP